MRKGAIVLFLALLVIFVFGPGIVRADDRSDAIGNATSCLGSLIEDSSSTLSLESTVFSILAGSPNNDLEDRLNSLKSSSGDCWSSGGSGCDIKGTSMAILALEKLGKNTDDEVSWLESKTGVAGDLQWFLQVTPDNKGAASCKIEYDNKDYDFSIDDGLKLSGDFGQCFTVANSGYNLQISPNCVEKEFRVSCFEGDFSNFLTNFLYKNSGSSTWYVSSSTISSAKGDVAKMGINAKCFKEGGECDYEGGLWAVTALEVANENYQEYLPYLQALASDNRRSFPSAFLYFLTGNDEQYNTLLQEQGLKINGGMWDVTGKGEYYDTGLAMVALGGEGNSELDETVQELFDRQNDDGCWNNNNIRDTAIIIYGLGWSSYWPGSGISIGGGGTGEVTDPSVTVPDKDCLDVDGNVIDITADGKGYCHLADPETWPDGCCDVGYECKIDADGNVNNSRCVEKAGSNPTTVINNPCEFNGYYCVPESKLVDCVDKGNLVPEYDCNLYSNKCCTVQIEDESCVEKGGAICQGKEECGGNYVSTAEGSCCVNGLCEVPTVPTPGGNQDECAVSEDCNFGEMCDNGNCVPQKENTGSSIWWIIILSVLIILVVLGIIFRKKLQMWIYKRRGKSKSQKQGDRSPGFGGPPGQPLNRRGPPRFGPFGHPPGGMPQRRPQGNRPPMNRGPSVSKSGPAPRIPPRTQQVNNNSKAPPKSTKGKSEKDKEMEETLRKLKEMSK